MTYAQIGKLYLCSIIRGSNWGAKEGPTFKDQPITEGLALEYGEEKSRCVIAFIRYDANNDTYKLESVGDRFMESITPDNLADAAFLCRYAERLMRDDYARYGEDY